MTLSPNPAASDLSSSQGSSRARTGSSPVRAPIIAGDAYCGPFVRVTGGGRHEGTVARQLIQQGSGSRANADEICRKVAALRAVARVAARAAEQVNDVAIPCLSHAPMLTKGRTWKITKSRGEIRRKITIGSLTS